MSALDELKKKFHPTDLDCAVMYYGNEHEAEPAAAELLALHAELADAKARAKTAEENWHKNEARIAKLKQAIKSAQKQLLAGHVVTAFDLE